MKEKYIISFTKLVYDKPTNVTFVVKLTADEYVALFEELKHIYGEGGFTLSKAYFFKDATFTEAMEMVKA